MGRFRFSTLQWAFVALLLLAGAPLLFVSEPDTGRFLARLAVLFLGGFAVSMALDARQTGTLKLRHTIIQRATRPWLFAATTGAIALCGFGLVVMALVMLFGPGEGPL